MSYPSWLPSPFLYEPYTGDERAYIDAAYEIFSKDFKTSRPMFNGKPIIIDARITYQDKEQSFWHVISSKSGTTEQRIPDFERCERIPWIKPIIDNLGKRSEIFSWTNQRSHPKSGRSTHTPILFNDPQYPHLIILQEQETVVALLSSYHIRPNSHKHKKLIQEYNACLQQTAATQNK